MIGHGHIFRDIQCFAEPQGPVEILEGIVKLAFGEIYVADVVQAQRFGIRVSKFPLNPQRFFVKLQRVIVFSAALIERAPVDQYRTGASLVAHLTIEPFGFRVMG